MFITKGLKRSDRVNVTRQHNPNITGTVTKMHRSRYTGYLMYVIICEAITRQQYALDVGSVGKIIKIEETT